MVLLVAIVAAIALTHRKRKETKYQDPGEQVKVRREDRVRLVNMPSEKKRRLNFGDGGGRARLPQRFQRESNAAVDS